MTKPDETPRNISPDPEQAYLESAHQLKEEGVPPDALMFQFQCQQCGLRCCMAPHVETVRFNPYSFAYIRATLPQDTLSQLFQLNALVWEVIPQQAPRLRVGGSICPFLIFHWDKTTKELFQQNLDRITDTTSPVFQLLLVHMLHDLTTQYYDIARGTGGKLVRLVAHRLISLFLSVWKQLSYKYPHLFPDHSEPAQGQFLTDFYMFLRYPPDPESIFQASCGIYSARPQVCRVFPLGRWGMFPADPDSLFSSLTDERVVLTTQICPSRAFIQGPSQTAKQFLQDQQVDEYEYTIYSCVGEFLQQNAQYLKSWPPEEVKQVYQGIIHRIYYTLAYTPDVEVFYQRLYTQLHVFIQGFHELYQRIQKKEPLKNEEQMSIHEKEDE